MAEEKVRRGLLLKTAMEILRDAGTKLQPNQVLEDIRHRLVLTPRELSLDNSGIPRYEKAVGFDTGFAATFGWTSKIGGWSITDAGIEALETYPDADDLKAELDRLYREMDHRRKQALQSLNEVEQFIATTLQLVEPGLWTAHDDLAELADTSPRQVADFLAAQRSSCPTHTACCTRTEPSRPRECSTPLTEVALTCGAASPLRASSSTPTAMPGRINALPPTSSRT